MAAGDQGLYSIMISHIMGNLTVFKRLAQTNDFRPSIISCLRGNLPVTSGFPSQRPNYLKSVQYISLCIVITVPMCLFYMVSAIIASDLGPFSINGWIRSQPMGENITDVLYSLIGLDLASDKKWTSATPGTRTKATMVLTSYFYSEYYNKGFDIDPMLLCGFSAPNNHVLDI